jgi:hypothetical protein
MAPASLARIRSVRIPGIRSSERRRRRLAVAAIGLAGLLVVTDLALGAVRRFWIEHAMVTALAGFAVTLGLTLLLVDGIVSRRRAERWSTVASIAIRNLSGNAHLVFAGWINSLGFERQEDRMVDGVAAAVAGRRPGLGAPPLLPQGFGAALAEALDDASRREELFLFTHRLNDAMEDALARWAPLLLQAPELVETVEIFALVQSSLSEVASAIDEMDESEQSRATVRDGVHLYLLAFSLFDAIRRDILGETAVFGHTADEHKRAWGLPFELPPPPEPTAAAGQRAEAPRGPSA